MADMLIWGGVGLGIAWALASVYHVAGALGVALLVTWLAALAAYLEGRRSGRIVDEERNDLGEFRDE